MHDRLEKARELLAEVTPLKTDCGKVCGARCCRPLEGEETGMLLFPGEEALYRDKAGFAVSRDGSLGIPALLLICGGTCDRMERPLSCRIFPLLPKWRDGRVRVVRDRRGFEVCPLLPSGLGAFDPAFVDAVRAAGEALYRVDAHREFLDRIHGLINAFAL